MSKIKFSLETPFRTIKCIIIKPDDSIVCCIASMTKILNMHDVNHLASVIFHQFEQNKWIIFVTNDDVDILSKENELFDCFILQCSKPEWAYDNYRELTRFKQPIDFYLEISSYSKQQKTFGLNIEKVLGKKIIG